MFIGPYALDNNLFVAPMAGVTDRPFRQLCKRLGAGYAVSEMVTSRPDLWNTLKTSRRANHDGEPGPIAVQIAGTDAAMMAEAARYNVDRGAQIIDINMGCPAKKVCNKWAGSALMQDESLALSIMIGRAAQGQPWIFREIAHFLETGEHLAPPLVSEVKRLLVEHLHDHYSLYGEFIGVRSARKHIGWYVHSLPGGEAFRQQMNSLQDSASQLTAVAHYLDDLNMQMDRIPARQRGETGKVDDIGRLADASAMELAV